MLPRLCWICHPGSLMDDDEELEPEVLTYQEFKPRRALCASGSVAPARRSSRANGGQKCLGVAVLHHIGDGALALGMRCQFR